ncbi:MAG: tRNA (adenosine(37)-N6)-dimethylallyltransferase MiaA [Tepidisphaeraceae bacterium]|jgi:tRNA dimethylallyltransferase
MAEQRPEILVILGPTASGKTDLAMRAAARTGAEILSMDSMQVYRGMDIGTAKPTPEERSAVRHHLIDVVDPDQPFAVARFVEMADAVIADAARRGVKLIATGGTPLYYKSLFEGLFAGPAADAELRQRLRAMGNEALYERLKAVDPPAVQRIHLNDTKRLVRALEVFELTGRPISDWQRDWGGEKRHAATWVGLSWDREVLNRRINARVKAMLAAGWVAETRGLIETFGQLSGTAAEATGYAELTAHLRGRMSLDDAVEQIKIATRQLARRQMKWFRRFEGVTWLPGDAPAEELDGRLGELGW